MALPSIANLFAAFSAAETDGGKGSGGEVRGLSSVERVMKGSFRFTSSSRDRDMMRDNESSDQEVVESKVVASFRLRDLCTKRLACWPGMQARHQEPQIIHDIHRRAARRRCAQSQRGSTELGVGFFFVLCNKYTQASFPVRGLQTGTRRSQAGTYRGFSRVPPTCRPSDHGQLLLRGAFDQLIH